MAPFDPRVAPKGAAAGSIARRLPFDLLPDAADFDLRSGHSWKGRPDVTLQFGLLGPQFESPRNQVGPQRPFSALPTAR